MNPPEAPKLELLHSKETLNRVKLDQFRVLPISILMSSLKPGQAGALKARRDGTVLDGHHRIYVLAERGEDIRRLPREIIDREP